LASILSAAGITIVKRFESSLYSALSVETDEHNIESLRQFSGAASAWPLHRLHAADKATTGSSELSARGFSDEAGIGNFSTHHMTGVNKLHSAGIKGRGAKIALIGHGVDYTLPEVLP